MKSVEIERALIDLDLIMFERMTRGYDPIPLQAES